MNWRVEQVMNLKMFACGLAAAALLAAFTMRVADAAEPDAAIISAFGQPIPELNSGELLLSEFSCLSCHRAESAAQARIGSRQGPNLADAGSRITPQYLRAFLANPHIQKPGTVMPDLLHAMSAGEKTETVDALTHFLSSLGTSASESPVGADQFKIEQGRILYHRVGCVACHAPQEPAAELSKASSNLSSRREATPEMARLQSASVPLGRLAEKTTVESLAAFLQDPLKTRPSGRMPSLNLTAAEATAIAMYLLRDQADPAKSGRSKEKIKGLSYQYFETRFTSTTQMEGKNPTGSGIIDRFTLSPRQRNDNVGLRFTGFIKVPADGSYTFYTASDDGTRLFIGTTQVVNNDGDHGTTEKSGTISLVAGEHPIMVAWFNGGGEATLKVSWEGPGFSKQEVPPSVLTTDQGHPMRPLGGGPFTVDAAKSAKGRQLFGSLGCAACHQIGNEPSPVDARSKSLTELNPDASDGCLNKARAGVPRFMFSDGQREALRTILRSPATLNNAPTPRQQIIHTMAALNCYACHTREGAGGPAPERAEYFAVIGEADLGEEGRMPPHLNRVGDKLRQDWLETVLLRKGAVRPYMATRMPQFGDRNVGLLVKAFELADSSPTSPEPAGDPSDAKWGRRLVGTGGLSCISCHTFAGHKSLGIPALDLATVGLRLKRNWFERYLLDPPSLRPGTRMPTFWPEGKSTREDILSGDTRRQISAIWAYLSNHPERSLPDGLIQGAVELVATNEAIIYRNFIQGAGARAIGVAYPEKANLAFDANQLRWAMIWQGPFIDAAMHRDGRGAGFVPPLGYNTVNLPPGPPFAMLPEASAPWPESTGKKAGYQMRGYRLDEKRRPAFLYSFDSIEIEDYPMAVPGELDAFFRRTLTLKSSKPIAGLWFRAWAGSKIDQDKPGQYFVDSKLTLRLQLANGVTPVVRQNSGRMELLVPVKFERGQAQIIEELIW
jgi:cytochrome c2